MATVYSGEAPVPFPIGNMCEHWRWCWGVVDQRCPDFHLINRITVASLLYWRQHAGFDDAYVRRYAANKLSLPSDIACLKAFAQRS